MRKHLIGTILVLAALAACNKEVETPAPAVDNGQEEVTPGKVTLTFKAAIGDDTRTEYPDDKTAGWVVGDKISVCVTDADNTEYKVAEFKATGATDTGMEFTGEVESGYTTIVSGIYPANDVYNGESMSSYFGSDGSVIGVNLPGTYDLGTANDTGCFIPMVGKMENGAFTFRHICGALKIEVVDIFNTLTFTTAETITGLFSLNNGRIAIPANGSASTVTFNYGRLSTNPTLGERGNRTFYIPVPDGTLTPGATMAIKNANNVSVFEKNASNNNGITFNSNVIKRFPVLGLNQRDDWTITPDLTGENPKIHFYLQDQNEQYIRISTTKANFESSYSGSVIEFIEKRINLSSGANTQRGSNTYSFSATTSQEKYFDDGAEKVYIMAGVIGTNTSTRTFTLDYQIERFTVPDPATPEYLAWLGDWQVTEDTETNPKTDTWTITRGATNSTYAITGLVGKTSIEAQGVYSSSDHSLSLRSQEEIGTLDGNNVSLLRRSNTTGNIVSSTSGNYFGLTIAKLLLNDGTVTISDTNYGYGLYWKNDNDKWTSYSSGSLKRIKFKPIERIQE